MIQPILKPKDQKKRRSTLPYREYRGGRQVCKKTPAGRAEYKRRIAEMSERQNHRCCLCGQWMPEDDRTFEHFAARGLGGFKHDDRTEIDGVRINGAAHGRCNGEKGSRRVPYVLQ